VLLSADHQTLYTKLTDFRFDDCNSRLGFVDRLARENGWSLDFAGRAIFEYKRFLFLVATAKGESRTPSDHIDQVWHLHLLYTHSYWDDLCDQVLGFKLHHGPTRGGKQERLRFYDQYDYTLRAYAKTFGHLAPAQLWPPPEIRLTETDFLRVNTHRTWTVKKPKWLWTKHQLPQK